MGGYPSGSIAKRNIGKNQNTNTSLDTMRRSIPHRHHPPIRLRARNIEKVVKAIRRVRKCNDPMLMLGRLKNQKYNEASHLSRRQILPKRKRKTVSIQADYLVLRMKNTVIISVIIPCKPALIPHHPKGSIQIDMYATYKIQHEIQI